MAASASMPPWSTAIFAQRGVDVLGHAGGVAAEVEHGTFLQPRPQVGAPLPETVLDVDLLGLVAGEGDVHPGERTFGRGLLPLQLVEEVVGEARSPKNSQLLPVSPRSRRCWTKARNGATPVPGPIITIGVSPVSGRRKWRFGRR